MKFVAVTLFLAGLALASPPRPVAPGPCDRCSCDGTWQPNLFATHPNAKMVCIPKGAIQ
ncbi:hypothetical protein DCS_05374 [Drechmeria coniospora]|uniref:Uncharacterized protein n=1 Tax=Drechmeria coniospora TaxID=98403 RepID=A0A151GMV2_DRECN|nr:hypothetical protein DCS_05374 [Drechmeria coniospora]KYK58361.1 hypothetical protein DCS_05374 [Drechmeria coniospora]